MPEKTILAEQPPGYNHWNVWLIEGEKKETIGQIQAEDPLQLLHNIRVKAIQTPGIKFTQAIKEIQKIMEWRTKKINEKKTSHPPRYQEERQTSEEFIDETAKSLMDRFVLRTFKDTGEIFYYQEEEGIYIPAEKMLETTIEYELKEKSNNRRVSEIINKIRRSTYIDREQAIDPKFIPIQNGIYDLEKEELLPFSSDHFFTSKHPVVFDPSAICPNINSFIDQITQGDIEKAWLLEKVAAYTLYRDYPIQVSFMLLGSGSNGKSVYLNLIRAMLGNENTSSVQLQEFSDNRFAAANLYGKNANIFADLESSALKKTGMFKSLTGDDMVMCERKFKQPFQFYNRAKLLFSCNQLPEAKDESPAYYRRWVIIEFNRQFSSEEQKPNIIKELTTTEELSGFFNVLVRRLKELLADHRFTDETFDEIREKYTKNANSAIAFLDENVEFNPDTEINKQALFNAYTKYCRQKSLPILTDKRFWKNLYDAFGDKVYEARVSNHFTGIRERVFKGIQLIEMEKQEVLQGRVRLADRLLDAMRAYKGPEESGVPLDYLLSLDFSEGLIGVQDCVKELKRNGTIFEPVHGFLRESGK